MAEVIQLENKKNKRKFRVVPVDDGLRAYANTNIDFMGVITETMNNSIQAAIERDLDFKQEFKLHSPDRDWETNSACKMSMNLV